MSIRSITDSMPISQCQARESKTAFQSTAKCLFKELDAPVIENWKLWQAQPEFNSPYFHPEFTACVDRVRDDVHVATAYQDNRLVAVLPYQYAMRNLAEPAGGALNDYHSLICDAKQPISACHVMQDVGIHRFKFHSWMNADDDIAQHTFENIPATVADFSDGHETFLSELVLNSSTIKRHGQKTRKLMREHGPIRLELNSKDSGVLDWVIARKREKYARTGVVDFFGVNWTKDLLHEIHQTQTDDFGGLLSALYAGDSLIAAHFGMRSRSVLHYWYPVYDSEFRQYSPGTQMFLEIVKQSSEMGINYIDFGYGDDKYKGKLTNRSFQVARGCVDFNSFRSKCAKHVDHVVSKVKASPAKQPLKRIIRLFMPNAGQPRV